jgi:hypothetical protein
MKTAHGYFAPPKRIPMALRGQDRSRPKVLPYPPTNSQAGLHPAGLSWGSSSAGLLMHSGFAGPHHSSSCRSSRLFHPAGRCHHAQILTPGIEQTWFDSISAPDSPATLTRVRETRPFAQTLCPSSRPAGLCVRPPSQEAGCQDDALNWRRTRRDASPVLHVPAQLAT